MIKKIAFIYLLSLVMLAWGIAIGKYEIFPYSYILSVYLDIKSFVKGDAGENTTLTQKIGNDLNIKPYRQLVKFNPDLHRDYSKFRIDGLNDRRDMPQLYADATGMEKGYRLISGVFDFDKNLHGIILLDSENIVVNTWKLHENFLTDENVELKPDTNKFPHGLTIQSDGSIIFAFDDGNSLQKWDWCSKPVWALSGPYNHSIELSDDEKYLWTWRGGDLTEIESETGLFKRRITGNQIIEANPETDIFGLRQIDYLDHFEWTSEKFHQNDIEPLLSPMADAFPDFSAGDLLVSYRSINLIFVLDPDTLKVKWWRVGQTRRQHDPDWQPDGSITIYDNNMHRNISKITRVDVKSYKADVIFDGKNERFYSWIRGKHQILPNGNILLSIPQQGRAIEVNREGNVVFEFLNTYNRTSNEQLLVADAKWLPDNYFKFDINKSCN